MAASVRWSAPPDSVAKHLLAGQPVGFAVRYRHLLRWRQVDFALIPLGELTFMNDQFAPFLDAGDEKWLLWQSATGSAVTTTLPCDAAALCRRLALLGADPQHAATTAALTELVEITWRQGGLPG
jgi:hypothetical protein